MSKPAETSPDTALDPITFAVIRSGLAAAAVAIHWVFKRVCTLPVLYEGNDYGAAVYDHRLNMFSESPAAPLFSGAFDDCENEHENHILAVPRAPAHMAPETAAQAMDITHRILDALDYVGVIAVEMFLVAETDAAGVRREKVVVNEIAPRVHNSGHWTIDGAETSQFEQHVRAIAGWPLGSPRRRGEVEMRNLIGDEAAQWRALAAEPGAYVHLYGKAEARPGRKMGHVTRVR